MGKWSGSEDWAYYVDALSENDLNIWYGLGCLDDGRESSNLSRTLVYVVSLLNSLQERW